MQNARKVNWNERKKTHSHKHTHITHMYLYTLWAARARNGRALERFDIGFSINKYIYGIYMHAIHVSFFVGIHYNPSKFLFLFIFLLFNFWALVYINIRLFSGPDDISCYYYYWESEKESERRNGSDAVPNSHWIFHQLNMPTILRANEWESERPIKYIDKYFEWCILCNGFWCSNFYKTSGNNKNNNNNDGNAHDTKSHGVVVIVDIVLFLLRPPLFFLLFHHLISFILPVVFSFCLYRCCFKSVCICLVGTKFGWTNENVYATGDDTVGHILDAYNIHTISYVVHHLAAYNKIQQFKLLIRQKYTHRETERGREAESDRGDWVNREECKMRNREKEHPRVFR